MKIIDWRTGQKLLIGDVADWGPAPKTMIYCTKVKGNMVDGPKGPIGVMQVDSKGCYKKPYPQKNHSPGYQLLAVKIESLTKGKAKLRMLKTNQILWWPLSIRFFTKHGLRVGYIID